MKEQQEEVKDEELVLDDTPIEESINLDNTESYKEVPIEKIKLEKKQQKKEECNMEYINCLTNERVIVRYIPKETVMVKNPKHVLYGGLAENATITYVVPILTSGLYVNVLTDNEKNFLENVMGLDSNALSIYRKENNFWDDSNEEGISKVTLTKQDNYFDLSSPSDYIKYKILLANKDYIAPSVKALQDNPKATYRFVIIRENEEISEAKTTMNATMECYMEFGKVSEDKDILRVIIETLDGRPTAANSKLDFLKTKVNSLIQSNPKTFLSVIKDPMLKTKVLIKKAIEAGIIQNRGNQLYLRADNTPLCEYNEEPTLSIAAKYLNNPKHQDVKFAIEAKLKN